LHLELAQDGERNPVGGIGQEGFWIRGRLEAVGSREQSGVVDGAAAGLRFRVAQQHVAQQAGDPALLLAASARFHCERKFCSAPGRFPTRACNRRGPRRIIGAWTFAGSKFPRGSVAARRSTAFSAGAAARARARSPGSTCRSASATTRRSSRTTSAT